MWTSDNLPVVRLPILMSIDIATIFHHFSAVCHSRFAVFKGASKLILGCNDNVAKCIGKANEIVFAHYSEQTLDRIVGSVIELEHIKKEFALVVEALYHAIAIRHKANVGDSIGKSHRINAANDGVALVVYIAIKLVLLYHNEAIAGGLTATKQENSQ